MQTKIDLIVGVSMLANHYNVSKPTIHRWIKLGMPALFIPSESGKDGTWYFHLENVENFWKKITSRRTQNINEIPSEKNNDLPPVKKNLGNNRPKMAKNRKK